MAGVEQDAPATSAVNGPGDEEKARAALDEADCTPDEADSIYKLSALANFDDRFVVPPFQREMAMEMIEDPHEHRSNAGFGSRVSPRRS